jgi:hypothetical protein
MGINPCWQGRSRTVRGPSTIASDDTAPPQRYLVVVNWFEELWEALGEER